MGHSECPQRYPVDDADEKERTGWGGRIRTYDTRYQKPMPYRLATPQRAALVTPGRRGDQDPLLTKTHLITISAGLRGCRVSPARAVRIAQAPDPSQSDRVSLGEPVESHQRFDQPGHLIERNHVGSIGRRGIWRFVCFDKDPRDPKRYRRARHH